MPELLPPELLIPEVPPVRRGSDAMREAMDAARDTLDQFLAAAKNPRPNQQKFLVKIFFVHKDQVEHIWMEHLDMSTTPFSGALANDPLLPGLECGQRKTFAKDRITDWMYFEDGKMIGGYTTKVLMHRKPSPHTATSNHSASSQHVN